MMTIEFVRSSLTNDDNWRAKQQPGWVEKCLSSALMGYLSLALIREHGAKEAIAWLKEQDYGVHLQAYSDTMDELVAEIEAKRIPSSVIGGNYHLLVFAHASWCIREFKLGERFVTLSQRKDVSELGTPFWREYGNGLEAVVGCEKFSPREIRLRGQERYWIGYIRLFEAICNSAPTSHCVAEISRLFRERNADSKISDDGYEIEGSGQHPVLWDFRFVALANYLEYRGIGDGNFSVVIVDEDEIDDKIEFDGDRIVYEGKLFSGIMRRYYPDKSVRNEEPFLDGFQEGWCREWDSNGVLRHEWFALQGAIHGKATEWHANRATKSIGYYYRGVELLYKEYDANGLLVVRRKLNKVLFGYFIRLRNEDRQTSLSKRSKWNLPQRKSGG